MGERGGASSGHRALAWGLDHGGPATKIHALTDRSGRAVAFSLGPGNLAGIPAAPALPDKLPPPARLPAGKGHDAPSPRTRLAASAAEAVIPSIRSRTTPEHTRPATPSTAPSAGSRTGAASQPDTTSSPSTPHPPSQSPPSSSEGPDGGLSLRARSSSAWRTCCITPPADDHGRGA